MSDQILERPSAVAKCVGVDSLPVQQLITRGLSVDALVASVLRVAPELVHDNLSYQSVAQWDSLQHVQLMIALERMLGIEIDGAHRVRLSSVRAIREFVCRHQASVEASRATDCCDRETSATVVHRGLVGIHLDRTTISRIDGSANALEYRGYPIEEMVAHSTFEETAFLLIHGSLPTDQELAEFRRHLADARSIPAQALELVARLAPAHPMEALRTSVSLLGALDPEARDNSLAASRRKGLRLIAQIPTLIGAHHSARTGRPFKMALADATHATALLEFVKGEVPFEADARLIDTDLIVHAEHGSNASTCAARVAVGCRASIHSATTAAISAFAGDLHGGAAEAVVRVLDEIGAPERARAYVERCMEQKVPVMGFGHRVYSGEDPRVPPLRAAALQASRARGDMRGFEIISALSEEMLPYLRHGVGANVDLYVGLLYRMLDLPDDIAVPLFVAGRIAGWIAHALEQQENNVLIRPLLHYVGPALRAHPRTRGVR